MIFPKSGQTVLAIQSIGEMGLALGQLLAGNGYEIVTALADRGPNTQQRVLGSGIRDVGTIDALLHEADILLSLVTPDAALPLAKEVSQRLAVQQSFRLCGYVDLNSISPTTAAGIEREFRDLPMVFIDGAVHGLAKRISTDGRIYLSGPQAQNVARLFQPPLQCQVIGDKIGQASLMRMLLSGFSKGINALFLEMAQAAMQEHMVAALLKEYETVYPALMEIVRRLLPTYPERAKRRGQEMSEVVETLQALRVNSGVNEAVRETIQKLGAMTWPTREQPWSVEEVVAEAFQQTIGNKREDHGRET